MRMNTMASVKMQRGRIAQMEVCSAANSKGGTAQLNDAVLAGEHLRQFTSALCDFLPLCASALKNQNLSGGRQ